MKFALRPYHVISLGGYIVETDFPYRNLIVVNKTAETIKFEIPVFDESWIQTHRDLGLDVITVSDDESFLNKFKKVQAELQVIKSKAEKDMVVK
ncbi:MAG: energy-converting hydrogenase B subunit P [archaeon]|nr:energy-converting hydrogenase B subunit P [archaeon]